jgi:hypothetical protein
MADMPPDVRQHILGQLASLTDKQFAEFFYEAVRGRNTADWPGHEGHFVLADAWDEAWAEVHDGEWVDFIGLAVEQECWSKDPGAPICQSGDCPKCQSRVRSWAKDAVCPVCGERVRCG